MLRSVEGAWLAEVKLGGSSPVGELRFYQGISKSLHFVRRAEERGLKEEVLEFILTFGVEFHRAGAIHLTVMECRLPKELRKSPVAQKARDWVVLIAEGETMLTCYRRKNAAKFLKKKPQRRLSEGQIEARHPQAAQVHNRWSA